MIGHTVVRPAGEVELPYLPDLVSPSLRNRIIVLKTHTAAAAAATENTAECVRCERSLQNKHGAGLNTNMHFTVSGSEAAAFPISDSKYNVHA